LDKSDFQPSLSGLIQSFSAACLVVPQILENNPGLEPLIVLVTRHLLEDIERIFQVGLGVRGGDAEPEPC
jgi:hypothetical protein